MFQLMKNQLMEGGIFDKILQLMNNQLGKGKAVLCQMMKSRLIVNQGQRNPK